MSWAITKLSVLLIIILNVVNASFPLYENLYQSKKELDCTKPKVTNKVPVSELCSFNFIEWENFVFRNDESFCNIHGTVGNNLTEKAIPTKILVYKDLVFVAVERVIGVFGTLGYFNINDITNDKVCPKLKCYPNCDTNMLVLPPAPCSPSTSYLTNVVDFQIDQCHLMWVLDVGSFLQTTIYQPIVLQNQQICIYNTSVTSGDPTKECIAFPDDYVDARTLYGFSTIIVNTIDGCDNAFAYIFNTMGAFLVVFSLKTKEFWRFDAVSLGPNPDDAKFKVLLPDYTYYTYAVVSGASGVVIDNNKVLFAERPGLNLLTVSLADLNQKPNGTVNNFDNNIQIVGRLNRNGQINSMVSSGNVVYASQEQEHAIVCYNKNGKVTPNDIQYLIQDRLKYPFIADVRLRVDKPGCFQIFFLSNNKTDIAVNGLDRNSQNFGIFYFDKKEADNLYPDCKGYYKDFIKVPPPQYFNSPLPYHQYPTVNSNIPTCHKNVDYPTASAPNAATYFRGNSQMNQYPYLNSQGLY